MGWIPGAKMGDSEELPPRVNPEEGMDPMGSDAFRLHNVNVYEERPDRAYLGYIDGRVLIGTRFFSFLASSIQVSFGQSAPSSLIHSSDTMIRSRLNSGKAVWEKPG